MKSEELEAAIYALLKADATLVALLSGDWPYEPIFSDVPQVPGDQNKWFPYVVIGETRPSPLEDKDNGAFEELIQVDAYSRAGDFSEVKPIAERLITLLHRTSLSLSTATHVLTELDLSSIDKDPDGETKRALLVFRVQYYD